MAEAFAVSPNALQFRLTNDGFHQAVHTSNLSDGALVPAEIGFDVEGQCWDIDARLKDHCIAMHGNANDVCIPTDVTEATLPDRACVDARSFHRSFVRWEGGVSFALHLIGHPSFMFSSFNSRMPRSSEWISSGPSGIGQGDSKYTSGLALLSSGLTFCRTLRSLMLGALARAGIQRRAEDMSSASQDDRFDGSMSLGNAFAMSPAFPPQSPMSAWSGWSAWDRWDEEAEARFDAELDIEEDVSESQAERNMEVTELVEMARQDHRQKAIDEMDCFSFWATCPDSIRKAGYEYVPPLPWRRDQDGPGPNDPKAEEFEERVRVLQRMYEDTIWKFGDPVPDVETSAYRIYKKRRAENLVAIVEKSRAQKKSRTEQELAREEEKESTDDAEEKKTKESTDDAEEKKESTDDAPPEPKRLLSDEFLLSLKWPGDIEEWLGPRWSSRNIFLQN